MQRKSLVRIATATAVLTALGMAVYAQDKYSLTSPSGIAFADFRGYEDWAVVSSARTEEVLKVIVANPAMIEAYKAGHHCNCNEQENNPFHKQLLSEQCLDWTDPTESDAHLLKGQHRDIQHDEIECPTT